jgi:hypothetical protein
MQHLLMHHSRHIRLRIDAARAKTSSVYQDFLTLRKDTDPYIPILKQAKAEYTKLL